MRTRQLGKYLMADPFWWFGVAIGLTVAIVFLPIAHGLGLAVCVGYLCFSIGSQVVFLRARMEIRDDAVVVIARFRRIELKRADVSSFALEEGLGSFWDGLVSPRFFGTSLRCIFYRRPDGRSVVLRSTIGRRDKLENLVAELNDWLVAQPK